MKDSSLYTKRNLLVFTILSFFIVAGSLLFLANFLSQRDTDTEDTSAATTGATLTVCATGTVGQNGCQYIGGDGIQQAVDAAESGDTVFVKNGTYTNTAVSISKQNLTIKGENKDSTILTGKTGEIIIFGISNSIFNISNLTIKNAGSYGIYLEKQANANINNNIISANTVAGIFLTGNSQATIANNEVSLNDGGIGLVENSQATIANNLVTANNSTGLKVKGKPKVTIINNTIAGNGSHGIDCGESSSCDLINNISVNNAVVGIIGASRDNLKSLKYNLAWSNLGNFNDFYTSSELSAAGNLQVNPEFVNLLSDFHLKTGSPAIDAGDPAIKDVDGSRSDMGMYGGPGAENPDDETPTPTPSPTPTATSTPTPTPSVANITPTPKPPLTGQVMTQTYLAGANNKVLMERTCPVAVTASGDSIDYAKCSTWKSNDISVLNGKDTQGNDVNFSAAGMVINSVSFMRYYNNDNEMLRMHVLVNNTDLYFKQCRVTNKALNCAHSSSTAWAKTDLNSILGVSKLSSVDVKLLTPSSETASKVLISGVSELGDKILTSVCTATNGVYSNCSQVSEQIVDEINSTIGEELGGNNPGSLASVDHHLQYFDGSDIFVMQTLLGRTNVSEQVAIFYYRLCPIASLESTGIVAADCKTGQDWFRNNTDIQSNEHIRSLNRVTSSVASLFSVTPTTPASIVSCSEKSVEFTAGGPYPGSWAWFTIKLDKPVPANTSVVVRDYLSSKLEIVHSTDNPGYPTYCLPKEGSVQSSVLGISDYYAESGSVWISILLLSAATGIIAYVIVSKNKENISWQLIADKPYLAGLIATGAMLIIGTSILVLYRQDVSPGDTPAATATYLECTPPAGTEEIRYRVALKAAVGDKIENSAEVVTGENTEPSTCSVDPFIVVAKPVVSPSIGETPAASATPEPTTEITPTVEQTPIASPTPEDTPDVTPTVIGFVCGAADINGDGMFTLYDFGKYQEGFASYYLKTCDDRFMDYGPCRGKDVDDDGFIDLTDFGGAGIGFAQRYNRESCALPID